MIYDVVIIGAGMYGLYAALQCGKHGRSVLVLEYDKDAFSRATVNNQARVHLGYHYPRSLSTASKSMHYFDRFVSDFDFCINQDFKKIYATSQEFSWTNAQQFQRFCLSAGIMCERIDENQYFKTNMCDGAFLTNEYTYDALLLKEHFLAEINKLNNVDILFNSKLTNIRKSNTRYEVCANDSVYETGFLLNTTYASINQILDYLSIEKFKIKYELCEIILLDVCDELQHMGITVMDGPFFSIMPYGKTGYHSLTSVTFTPHSTSYDALPQFECQKMSWGACSPKQLANCNTCNAKPQSAWPYMNSLAKKYLSDRLTYRYVDSLYSIKPILKSSEIDDSRPTVIQKHSEDPSFISILSGKINTVYDLDDILMNEIGA